MELQEILEEVKQMGAPEFEALLGLCAAIAKDTAEFEPTKPDPAWVLVAHHLAMAHDAITKRKGN